MRRSLRISIREGSFAALHFTFTTGAFLTGFALYMGANDLQLAWILAVPMAAQLFQLAGAWMLEHTGHRRAITIGTALTGRLLWLPMAFIPLLPHHAIPVFIGFYLLSSALQNMAGPVWVSWMSDLVPSSLRGRYFANRNLIVGLITMPAGLLAGLMMDAARDAGGEYEGYVALFAIASVCALCSWWLIRHQHDPGFTPEPVKMSLSYWLKPFQERGFRRIVWFYLFFLSGVSIASPFFSAHLMKNLQWNYRWIVASFLVTSVVSLMSQRFWGKAIDRWGHKPVLYACILGVSTVPLPYAFCPYDMKWPIFLNAVLAGMFWPGMGLTMFNLMIAASPQKGRALFVASLSALSGVVNFLSSMAGGWIAHALDFMHMQWGALTIVNYQALFALSAVLRLFSLGFAYRIEDPGAVPVLTLLRNAYGVLDRQLAVGRQWLIVPAHLHRRIADGLRGILRDGDDGTNS